MTNNVKKKKIILIIDIKNIGGALKYAIDLFNNLSCNKYEKHLFINKSPVVDLILNEVKTGSKNHVIIYKSFFDLFFKFRSINPEIVHLNLTNPYSCIFGMISAVLSKSPKIIATQHSVQPVMGRFLILRLIRRLVIELLYPFIHKFIVVSNAAMKEFIINYKVPRNKIVMIHNGIETNVENIYINKEIRREISENGKFFVISFISRLTIDKGAMIFVETAKIISKNMQNIKFLITGEGPMLELMKKELNLYGILDRCIFTGVKKDVYSYIYASDIIIQPSYHETLGYVILESMNLGKTVIASNVGGIPEIIKNGENGFLVNKGDSKSIAQIILTILKEPSILDDIDKKARQTIKSEFFIERFIKETEKLYG